MNKWLKFLLYTFLGLFLCLLLIFIALSLFFNPNDYKPKIESLAQEKIGRKLAINGELHWTVFPWLGLSTGQVILSNAPGFSAQAFASVESATVQVKLLPLFSSEIEVDRIVIQDLVLNLEKNDQGIPNWTGFGSDQDTDQKDSPTALAALAIGGISIKNAALNWDDRQNNSVYHLSEINLESDKIQFDTPVETTLSAVVKDPGKADEYQFDLQTKWQINEQLENLELSDLGLNIKANGETIPNSKLELQLTADASLDLKQNTLDIPKLLFSAGDLDIEANVQGKSIKDNPVFSGSLQVHEVNLKTILQQFAVALPELSDPEVLQSFTLQSEFIARQDAVEANSLQIQLDETQLEGFIKVKQFAKPETQFNFSADQINLDRYLPAKTATVAATIQTESVAPPSTAVAAATAEDLNVFPVDTIRNLNVNGNLSIQQLKVKNLNLNGFSIALKSKSGLLQSRQKVEKLYQGNYQGNFDLNVKGRQPVISLSDKLSNVQLEPLLTDLNGKAKMTGLINADLNISARGNTNQALKASSNGDMKFVFSEGVIKGFNIAQIIEQGKLLFSKDKTITPSDNSETHYSKITATAKINNGIAKNDDLLMTASDLRISGAGTANLNNDQLDYKVTGKLIRKQATETEPEKLSGVPVVIDIRGSFDQPKYQINLTESIPKDKQEKIIRKVEDKLGKDAGKILKSLFK